MDSNSFSCGVAVTTSTSTTRTEAIMASAAKASTPHAPVLPSSLASIHQIRNNHFSICASLQHCLHPCIGKQPSREFFD